MKYLTKEEFEQRKDEFHEKLKEMFDRSIYKIGQPAKLLYYRLEYTVDGKLIINVYSDGSSRIDHNKAETIALLHTSFVKNPSHYFRTQGMKWVKRVMEGIEDDLIMGEEIN